jgi:3-phosphoshikimate 1-carboxyvinyltransferase
LGSTLKSHGDHRIAMCAAVAGLGAEGETTVRGWPAVAISYPGFEADLATLLAAS